MTPTIIWLSVFVLCLIIEIITLGLTSIWFTGGALLAMVIALVKGPLWLQILVFLVTSIVLMIFTRPIAMKYFNKNRIKTNVETMAGKRAIVTETVDNLKGTGKIVTDGMEWTARSKEDSIIEEGSVVTVIEIQGVKAIIRKGEE